MIKTSGVVRQEITLQTQPDMKTCGHACLAMVLAVPVESIIDRYGGEVLSVQEMCSALEECGVTWDRLVFGTIMHAGWYILSAPSLNIRAGMHYLIIRFEQDGTIVVFDPAMGTKYQPDGGDLISWSDVFPFLPGGQLPGGDGE